MKLRDKYFNKETGEIRTVVLVYNTKSVCGLAIDSKPNEIIETTEEQLALYWEKL